MPEPSPPDSATAQSDMDSASQTTELNYDQNMDGTTMTSILLEIRRDVKQMNKRFGHIEKSVKSLKEQNTKLAKQVTDLQTTVAYLESRT